MLALLRAPLSGALPLPASALANPCTFLDYQSSPRSFFLSAKARWPCMYMVNPATWVFAILDCRAIQALFPLPETY